MQDLTPASVALDGVIEGLLFQSDEQAAFLNTQTGKIIFVTDDDFRAAETGTKPGPAWDDAWWEEVQAIAANDPRYLMLPNRFEIDEYGMMIGFAKSIANDEHSGELLASLQGRRAFRRFKDCAHRLGLADEWYAYRDRAYKEIAIAWCEEHEIPFDPEPTAPRSRLGV